MSIKNSSETIGNRTRDLPAGSAVFDITKGLKIEKVELLPDLFVFCVMVNVQRI